jgi:hypothetical protein
MPDGSVYKDHTFNSETAHLTKTPQYIARINIHSTLQYIYISTIQVHEPYIHKKQTIEKIHNTLKKHLISQELQRQTKDLCWICSQPADITY